MIETGDIILECGGHHGCTAILLSKWVGENGRVVTFEPDPRSVAILNKNVTLNRLANVVVEAKAVGAQENRIRFTIRSGVLSTSAREVGAIEIGMTTLDNYLDLNPTFAKIDVEGYEYEVVKGASRLLERRPKLEIEIHPAALVEHGSSPAQVLALIPLREYDCFIQWNDETEPVPFSGDEPIEKRAHFFAIPKERRT
jgi:FkbM family methyltransferase